MSGAQARTLATVGVLGGSVPLLMLVGRVLYAAVVPTPMDALLVDLFVLSLATIGTTALLGAHLQSAFSRPLADLQSDLDAMLGGRLDGPRSFAGPNEVQQVARSVQALGQSMERRLHTVTRASGVAATGSVLTGVAHEVSNALASMRLSVHLLSRQETPEQSPAAAKAMQRVSRGLERLEQTVVTLRAAGGPPGLHSPRRLVGAALIVAQRWTLATDVRVQHLAVQQLDCYPDEVVQALVALLQNAAESGAKHIWVTTRDVPQGVSFTIEDDGQGIASAVASQLMEPFVTTKPNHAGLGLHHAALTSRRHGGWLSVTNRSPGVTATLRLSGRQD